MFKWVSHAVNATLSSVATTHAKRHLCARVQLVGNARMKTRHALVALHPLLLLLLPPLPIHVEDSVASANLASTRPVSKIPPNSTHVENATRTAKLLPKTSLSLVHSLSVAWISLRNSNSAIVLRKCLSWSSTANPFVLRFFSNRNPCLHEKVTALIRAPP